MSSSRRTAASVFLIILAGTVATAAAEPARAIGVELRSRTWSRTAIATNELAEVVSYDGGLVKVRVFARHPGGDCATFLAAVAPAGGAPPPGALAGERGVVAGGLLGLCREVGGRAIGLVGRVPDAGVSAARAAALLELLADVEASLQAQRALVLLESKLDLGPRFDRWHPSWDYGDQLELLDPAGPATGVLIRRKHLACDDVVRAEEQVARPAYVPRAFHGRAGRVASGDSQLVVVCLPHGAGSYSVVIETTIGASRAQRTQAEASVRDLLTALATAVARTPPMTVDEVSGASDDGEYGDDGDDGDGDDGDNGDDAPTVAAPPPGAPAAVVAEPAPSPAAPPAPDAAADSSSASASAIGFAPAIESAPAATGRRRWRGQWPWSPVLLVHAHRLELPATMTTAARDALGGALTVRRQLSLVGGFGAEWSGTLGYDALAGVAFDARAGGGMVLAGALAMVGGVGLDGWTGDVALPTEPYLYVGGRLVVAGVVVRAEYLPRNGGTDETRVGATYTRYRPGARKVVVEGGAVFVADATTLLLGIGVGI